MVVYSLAKHSLLESAHPSLPLLRHPPRTLKVVNRTMICLALSATGADWTRAGDYLGPLKIEVRYTVNCADNSIAFSRAPSRWLSCQAGRRGVTAKTKP